MISLTSVFEMYAWVSYNIFNYMQNGAQLISFRILSQSFGEVSIAIKLGVLAFVVHFIFNIIFVSYVSYKNSKDPMF